MNFIDKISSKKAIFKITILEFLFYGFIIYTRINRIVIISNIDPGLRSLINVFDYESGWNLVFLFFLVLSCILSLKYYRLAWIIKQIGLICLIVSLGFIRPYIGIISLGFLIYISLNPVAVNYGIEKKNKIILHVISSVIAIVLLIASSLIDILIY